jgi:cell division protein FtsL
MLRLFSVAAAFLTLAAAFVLYSFKYDTRALEVAVQARERRLEKLETDIAVLKAERAYLARPDRLEKLARKQGLGSIRQDQYVEIGAPIAQDAPAQASPARRSAK